MHQEECFAGADGLTLFWRRWLPERPARAAVIVAHGFAEHSGRYARTAEDLVRQGYAVHAMDWRGHGRSAGERCFIRSYDEYLRDLDVFVEQVRQRESPRPVFLLGHSMGGLMATAWCITRQPSLAGLVLSGPALRLRGEMFPLLRHLAGVASRLLPRWKFARMGFRYMSRDPAVVAAALADPLVFQERFPVRMGAEVLRAMRAVGRHMEAVRLPLLILHGTADRACDPAGSEELCRRAASTDKTLRLYEGLYHEILSEPERDEVVADLVNWLDARCAAASEG